MSPNLRSVPEFKSTRTLRTLSSVFRRSLKSSDKENVAPDSQNADTTRKAKGKKLASQLELTPIEQRRSSAPQSTRPPLNVASHLSSFDSWALQSAPPPPPLPLGSANARLAVLNGAAAVKDSASEMGVLSQPAPERTLPTVSPSILTASWMRNDLDRQMSLLEVFHVAPPPSPSPSLLEFELEMMHALDEETGLDHAPDAAAWFRSPLVIVIAEHEDATRKLDIVSSSSSLSVPADVVGFPSGMSTPADADADVTITQADFDSTLTAADFEPILPMLSALSHGEEIVAQEDVFEAPPPPLIASPVLPSRLPMSQVVSWQSPLDAMVARATAELDPAMAEEEAIRPSASPLRTSGRTQSAVASLDTIESLESLALDEVPYWVALEAAGSATEGVIPDGSTWREIPRPEYFTVNEDGTLTVLDAPASANRTTPAFVVTSGRKLERSLANLSADFGSTHGSRSLGLFSRISTFVRGAMRLFSRTRRDRCKGLAAALI